MSANQRLPHLKGDPGLTDRRPFGPIPRGIEVLVKKAAVDPTFRKTLMAKRAGAADEIGLRLEPTEAVILGAVPAAQLEAIIANTDVGEVSRAAFLGRAAAAMLAALGAVSAQGCSRSNGCQPDSPPRKEDAERDLPPAAAQSPGSRPDPPPDPKPLPKEEGAGTDPAPTTGESPEAPAEPKPLERPTEVRPKGGVRP